MSTPPPVAILLGFSGVGKSKLKREFELLEQTRKLDIRDTDVMIGRDHGGHVYGVFLDLVTGKNRAKALAEIEAVERDFLTNFKPQLPTLVVAGPALVTRSPEWATFAKNWTPRGVYLMTDAMAVFDALKYRYNAEAKIIGQHPAFGSWNQDVTTDYDVSTQRWKRLDHAAAFANIERRLAAAVPYYEKASNPSDRYLGGEGLRENRAAKDEIVGKIRQHLGV